MTTYTIFIENKSMTTQEYMIFNQPPDVSEHSSGASILWMKAPPTPSPHGLERLDFKNDVFALCGTLPAGGFAEGTLFSQTDSAPVTVTGGGNLGTAPTMKVEEGLVAFEIPYGTTTASDAFGINTGNWDATQDPPSYWCGMGRYGIDGQTIVPTAAFPAVPNESLTLSPNTKFLVASGGCAVGSVVDLAQIGALGVIDFETAHGGETIATIVQKADSNWTDPVFRFQNDNEG